LILDGRIKALGTLNSLCAIEPGAQLRDLDGKTLMPAFVDGHSHMSSMGLFQKKCDLTQCTSFDDILNAIRGFIQKNDLTHGEYISCRGYDHNRLKEQRHPTAAVLDALNVENPIGCTHQSGHMSVFNSKAMEICGIDDSFAAPSGGYAGRDDKGHLTGYFEESAQGKIKASFENVSSEQLEEAILSAQDYYLSHGITTIQDGSGNGKQKLDVYRKLADTGKLKADVIVYMEPVEKEPGFWSQTIASFGNREYRNHLKLGGIKLLLDGSPQAKTAWMRKPYEGDLEYCGYPTKTDQWVGNVLKNAISTGLQPIAHCNGDAAAQQFIDQWKDACGTLGHGAELRPMMIHAQTVGADQLDQMVPLGINPSFFVGHCWYWGDTHIKNFGQRGYRISPVRDALNRGLIPNFHQDSPVTPPDMLHTVWCAVNRLTGSGTVIGKEQAITPYEALIACTNGSAYSYFEENEKGILKPGAIADMIILDQDPTEIDAMEIRNISVLETIKDGQTIYRKQP